jgi:hypothetical protein
MQTSGGRPSPSGLADVIDTILDKGLVIDAYVRISLVGIELVTIDARIVIASVDTYLRFAEAVNRLDISDDKRPCRISSGTCRKAAPNTRPRARWRRQGRSSATSPETAENGSPPHAAAAMRRTEMAASPKTQKATGSDRRSGSAASQAARL